MVCCEVQSCYLKEVQSFRVLPSVVFSGIVAVLIQLLTIPEALRFSRVAVGTAHFRTCVVDVYCYLVALGCLFPRSLVGDMLASIPGSRIRRGTLCTSPMAFVSSLPSLLPVRQMAAMACPAPLLHQEPPSFTGWPFLSWWPRSS